MALRKQLRLVLDIDPALTDLVLDPARFKQVLYNYLSNAIKFTPEGGQVTLRARAAGPQAFRVEVEDTGIGIGIGIGIGAGNLSRLFVKFQQLDDSYSKQHQGTGLGLAPTRRLVQAQGGSVGVRSSPDVGSVFYLEMPRVPGAAADGPALPVSIGGAPRRLLVIEGDQALQGRLRDSLQAAGFDIDLATTGQQAVAQARDKAYDSVTLGLQLRDLQGLDVLASIRAEGASRDVLALSLPVAARQSAAFAITDLLSKPIRTAEPVSAISALRPMVGRRTRVMVVDDDPLALDLMMTTLQGLAIDVVGMNGGRQALHEIDHYQPDALILDLMMPDFDGFATLDALRRLAPWQHLPVFIWSSMILTDDELATLTGQAPPPDGALPHVRVVDDNPVNLELASFVLASDGWRLSTAGDALEALQCIAQCVPDLILMNIQLPGMDGLTLTRQIKADPALRHITVVAFTAYPMKGDEEIMRVAGCDGYLDKPIDVGRFAAQVRDLLPALGPR